MKYEIYFDESNKLDQPNGGYSYYGAYGAEASVSNHITSNVALKPSVIKNKC